MSTTTTACYICKDDMDKIFYFALFDGGQKPICIDCADGITNGLQILTLVGVTGETQDK